MVKSGVLCITTHESLEKGRVIPSRWNKRWFVLNSTGTLDFFYYDEQKGCSTERLDGNINLDFCSGMFIGEADTGEPFSIGLKLGKSTYYLKAENRLELDNWSRVLKPFVQASQAFIPRRSSSSSSAESDVFAHSTSTSLGRAPSFGKSSVSRVSTTPLSTKSTTGNEEQQTSLQLEKLKDENKRLREQSVLSVRQKDSTHILELELKTKVSRIKELEKELSQCRDYQKALLFQEKELLEARTKMNDLKQQMEEKEKLLQQHKGKLSIHAKELAEAKADLQEANSIIGIHRANIESLKNELTSVKNISGSGKEKLIVTGEEPESDQVFSLKTEASGNEGKDLESKLSALMQKLKQNERELLVKTRELEKANESRSKVAKYTRSLLQELESKLSNNERKLAETENQLVNKNVELEYEKERRLKVEEENNRLFSELELLSDERKKDGLSKEVVELLKRAKERVASENIVPVREMSVETGLTSVIPKTKDDEKRTSNGVSYVEEIDKLKLVLASAESSSDQSDSETSFRSAKKETDRLKDRLKVQQRDYESLRIESSKIKEDLKKRDTELDSLRKELRKLEDRNADVVEKNRELEERLQTVESELTESMEREIFLQTENETDEGERWDVKERIVGLEEEVSIYKDKIDELETKLVEKESKNVNVEKDRNRVHELERLLKIKEDELKEIERRNSRRERELKKEEETKRDEIEIELSREKLRLQELEEQFGQVQNALDSERNKSKVKENELDELKKTTSLMVYREDAERHIDELESELKEKEDKLFERESSLSIASERIAECEEKLRNYELKAKEFVSKNSADLEKKIRELQEELEDSRERLAAAEEKLEDFEVEEKLLAAELHKSEREDNDKVDEVRKKLTEAEEKIKKYEDFAKDKNSKLIASEEKVIELAEELARRLAVEQETAEWIEGVENNLTQREKELNVTRESLVNKAKDLDKEKYSILDVMELSMRYIKELELAVGEERENAKELERQLDDERARVTQMVQEMKSVESEGNKNQDALNDNASVEERLSSCEIRRELESTRVKQLQTELEDSKRKFAEELSSERDSHVNEMRKLNEEALQVSGAANSEADELKLRLTSRVITLQSDISELKAAHHQELEKLRAQHKKELENARREAILETSAREVIRETDEDMVARVKEVEDEMKEMTERYESQMETLKKSHSREMDKLKRSSGDGVDGLQTEVVQLQVEMENMSQKYMEEIENLKVQHGEELEQLKRDMAVVLQASLGAAPSSAKDDSNVQLLKNRINELEQQTEELSRKYNEELKAEREKQQREIEQTRNDMMTVIQAIRSEKYADEGRAASPRHLEDLPEELAKMQEEYEGKIAKLQEEHEEALREAKGSKTNVSMNFMKGEQENDSQLKKKVRQLEAELLSCKEEFQKQLQQKDTKHDEEVNLLKADMLVALQVARSGNLPPAGASQPDSQTSSSTITHGGTKLSLEEAVAKITSLEKTIETTKKQAKKEKSDLEKSLKKSEAATMFGLRRTEEMSIKIYQMQKEMEIIDRKYQKEIQMYKDAFEREKEEKCQLGDWETLSSENDSLRLEIEELDLKIEEMENTHQAEINMYKQKLGEEEMQSIESLRLKIKSLEDVIEEQKLEHEKELEDLKLERDASVQELKRRHEKELENVKSEQRVVNVGSSHTRATSFDLQQKDLRIKELELKVEEQETLLEVKRRRHKEEIKSLRQRLDDEMQKHTEDVRSHRTKVRMLERRKSEHSISFGLVDDDYKRMYDEQRSENIKLKFTVEKQKKELDDMRTALAAKEEKAAEVTERRKAFGESRRPVSDSFPSGFSYSRTTPAQDSSSQPGKVPLRKVSSDNKSDSDPVWKRASGGPLSRQASEGGLGKHDVGKGKIFTRQLSKGVEAPNMGSVAARVALYQTVASKFKDKDEKTGQRKP